MKFEPIELAMFALVIGFFIVKLLFRILNRNR